MNKTVKVDHNALRFNQAGVIACLVIGFVWDQPVWVLGVALALLLARLNPRLSLFMQIYRRMVLANQWMKPDWVADEMRPHRFAQTLGGVMALLAYGLLLAGYGYMGWITAWVVVLLAAVNLQLGFCLGCFLYYQCQRIGIFR